MGDNEQYLLNEQVSFVQHFLPGLNSGQYQLQVDQQVFKHDGITPVSGKAYSNTYTFAVTSDRFRLANPASVLTSVFPADNGSGEYTNVLPHVVFSKNTFPWTRYPTLKVPYTPPKPGSDVDSDVPTWLWVMLLDEEDVTNFPGLNLKPVDCTIGDLYPKIIVDSSTLLPGNHSYFDNADDLSGLEPGQNTADGIQAIDIPLGLFWQIGPTIDDLNELAHGRVVSLVNQPNDGKNVIGEPTGSFSIVFGNRLPNNQKKAYAFLVSLEKLADFLPQTGGLPPKDPSYKPSATLRLAVLKSWTFFSTGQSATFVHQLESLNGCTPGGPPATNTNIRIAYNGSNAVVKGALNMGYVPLNETMRTAENNVSWYRGPLVPYSITTPNITIPILSPDAATILDPTTGMLDVSYAAAWTIGRMVALQDDSFSTGLYTWKKGLTQQIVTNIENELIAEEFTAALLDIQPAQDEAGRKTVNASTLFKQTVLALKKEP